MLTRPYYKRLMPMPQTLSLFAADRINLSNVHLPDYPEPDPAGLLPDLRHLANSLFDGRAAAAVRCSVGDLNSIIIEPVIGNSDPNALLERNDYKGHASPIYLPTAKCLAAIAFADYFSNISISLQQLAINAGIVRPVRLRAVAQGLGISGPISLRGLLPAYAQRIRTMVSDAIMEASPGYCGTYGIGVTGLPSLTDENRSEGNYDMTQMFLIPLAYNYHSQLRPEAQEKLITLLLARGRIHRPREDDTFTNGQVPGDWSRAGFISPLGVHVDLVETENHVLMIATARYLTNQLLYQRGRNPTHDNRRNGCLEQLCGLLRNYLRDDFAEYNAKNYQEETRHALLNLCSYAYDAEVRLGARMVLDYVSAHIAVSSNDLRRMVPFRRRSEGRNVNLLQVPGEVNSVMDVGLLDGSATGADPMPAQFALLAGNTRAYLKSNWRIWPPLPDDHNPPGPTRPWDWAITPDFSHELTLEAVSNYRLPPSVHDLFVNDSHRRFFQRIHRRPLEEPGQQRNCDNMEIYASSPSYLITAGGRPARWVIEGAVGFGFEAQNIGVAVPTSFMPTGTSARNIVEVSVAQLAISVGISAHPVSLRAVAQALQISAPFWLSSLFVKQHFYPGTDDTSDLIQISGFSDSFEEGSRAGVGENYGVAPDFACGATYHFPAWTAVPYAKDGIFFVDKKARNSERPGFFLAIIKQGLFAVLEAFDTWRHPEVTFSEFKQHVIHNNASLRLESGEEAVYTTYNGNVINFVVWDAAAIDNHQYGAKILRIDYGSGDPRDTLIEAGNYPDQTMFLDGTILNSPRDAVTEINNPYLGTKITLDWSDPSHLVRISEDGEVEQAGKNAAGQLYEVWVDFDWNGPFEGDFYHPFNQLAGAIEAVADGGVIKIAPGASRERFSFRAGKQIKLVAPVGGVIVGAR
jgi:hypothetical protein